MQTVIWKEQNRNNEECVLNWEHLLRIESSFGKETPKIWTDSMRETEKIVTKFENSIKMNEIFLGFIFGYLQN